jgi:phosphoglycerate kinase
MSNLDLRGKRVLIREDLNVPVKKGVITSDARILAALPTLRLALQAGARVMVMSHLGRPAEGGTAEENAEFTLAPVAAHLGKLLACNVPLVKDYLAKGVTVEPGQLVLLEKMTDAISKEKLSIAVQELYKKKAGK